LYVQLKDDKVKQSFKPNTWTPMLLNGKDAINPTKEGNCFWEAQLHLTLPKTGRPTYVKINFSRDYKGKNDMERLLHLTIKKVRCGSQVFILV
jgi:hypothetical protein